MAEENPARRILVVEDEYFIANTLSRELVERGMAIVGPTPDIEGALSALESGEVSAAVLDLNLEGKADFTVADALERHGVPFVFATGYDTEIAPPRFAHIRWFEKPYDPAALAEHLEYLLKPRH